jgi:hypothetical protein
MVDQAGGALGLVAVEPSIHGIGVAWLQEAVLGDVMRGLAPGDLQDGGAALADVGAWVVVAEPK